jgi:FkbM family methyltransferase
MSHRILTKLLGTGFATKARHLLGELGYHRAIRIRGVRVVCPTVQGITCGLTEPWLLPILDVLLAERPGTFIDVGVNLGQSLVKLKSLDPQRQYVGFEPNPFCVVYVQRLIEQNQYRNTTLLPVALFTEDCVLPLDLYSAYPADPSASVIEAFRPDQKVYSRLFVPALRFESVTRQVNVGKVAIVKVDVEGAELEALASLSGAIAQDRPILLMEVLPVYSDKNVRRKARQDEIERILSDADYAIYRIRKGAGDSLVGVERLERFDVHSDLTKCDYLIAPDELAGCLEKRIGLLPRTTERDHGV